MDDIIVNLTDFDVVPCLYGSKLLANIRQSSVMFSAITALARVSLVSTFLTILANVPVIVTICRTSSLWNKMYYKGLLLMSMTDLLTGLLTLPLATFIYWSFVLDDVTAEVRCRLWTAMVICASNLSGISVIGAVLITVERYLKICYSTRYQDFVSLKKALYLFLIMYGVAVLGILILRITISWEVTGYLGLFLVSFYSVCMSYMYFRIFKVVRESNARVNHNPDENARRMLEQRLAKTFVIIIVAFISCFMPYSIVSILWYMHYLDERVHIAHPFALYIGFFNSLLNPCIYVWQDSNLRKSLITNLCCDVGRIGATNREQRSGNRTDGADPRA